MKFALVFLLSKKGFYASMVSENKIDNFRFCVLLVDDQKLRGKPVQVRYRRATVSV